MLLFFSGFLAGFISGFMALIAIGRSLRRRQATRQPTLAQHHKALEQGIAVAQ
jgi:hypothetical protein